MLSIPSRVTSIGPLGTFVALNQSCVSGFVQWSEIPPPPWRQIDEAQRAESRSRPLELGEAATVAVQKEDTESGTPDLSVTQLQDIRT